MSKQLSKRTKNKLDKLLENTGDMALKRRARRIIEEINPEERESILEVGCGDGFYLHLISELGIKKLKLTGIDYDNNALKSARKNLKGRRITLKHADLMKKIPFKANTFDKIIMSEVAEHLPNDVKGLKEVKRVLKKGGTLVVTVPNHNYPLLWDPINWILEHTTGKHIKDGFWAGLWNMHIRLYKPSEIRNAVEDAGLQVTFLDSMTWWCLPFNHNIMHFGAVRLHSGEMDKATAKSINKFESKKPKRPFYIDLAFRIVNAIDKLNDVWSPQNRGVGVIVRSKK